MAIGAFSGWPISEPDLQQALSVQRLGRIDTHLRPRYIHVHTVATHE